MAAARRCPEACLGEFDSPGTVERAACFTKLLLCYHCPMIRYSILKKATKKNVDDLNGLAAALREVKKKPAQRVTSDLSRLQRNPDAVLFVARDKTKIVGMAILYVLQKIGKKIATVEDVVVSSDYRGHGIGENLMQGILKEAKRRGVGSIGLTSRASRVVANRLYQKLGFKQRDTNVYKLDL